MRIIGVIVVALGLGVAAPAAVWAAGWGGIEPGEILRCFGHPVCGEIGRAGADDLPDGADLDRP